MANNDMNIAMKFTADVNRAKDNISQLNAELKESANVAQDANKKSAQSIKDVYTAQTEAMNRGAQAASAAEKQAKAQSIATKAAEAHKKEVEKLRQGLDKLLASIDPATKGLSRLDELESKLRKSKKAGVIDTDTFDDYLGKINNQRAALSTVETLNEGTKRLVFNTKSAHRTFFMMSKQLATGNFNGISNSLFSIANMTGKLPSLFGAAAISAGVFIAAAYKMSQVISTIISEQERFNRALISTGNYAGATAGGLEAMSQRIGKINHNYSETRGVIAELTSEGRLSAKSIENIATASAYMAQVTGKSAQDAVQSFKGIENSVTSWAVESNKQYHFLDLATYQRISALEEQGRTEEAIAIATDKYASEMEVSANKMEEQLNWLEDAWRRFKNGVSVLGNELKKELKFDLGLSSLEEDIEKMEKAKKRGFYIVPGSVSIPYNKNDDKALQEKYAQRDKLQKEAQEKHDTDVINEKAINAQKELDELHKQNASDAEKQAKAVDELRKKYEALWANEKGRKDLQAQGVKSKDGKSFSGGQYDKDVQEITDKQLRQYNEQLKNKVALQDKSTALAKALYEIEKGQYKNASQEIKKEIIANAKLVDEQEAKKLLSQYNEQLKNKVALQEKSTALAKALYEIEKGQYKNASPELKKEIIANAKLVDAHEAKKKAIQESARAAKSAARETEQFIKSLESQADKQTQKTYATRQALIDSQKLTVEQRNRANAANNAITAHENKKLNDELQNQLNSLLFDPARIKTAEIDRWYQAVIAQLKANKNIEGIDLIDQLLPLKKAEANISEILAKVQQAQSQQSIKEQSIQAQVTAGLITQIEAQSQLVDLHKQTAQELAKYLPTLQAMTALPGQVGENAQKALATLQLQIAELNKTTDALTNAFKNGLQSGIQGSLDSLAKGTFELKDALLNLAQSIVSAMAQVASKGLADIAMNQLSNLGKSLFSSITDTAVENASAISSAELMGTAITTAASVGSVELGTSLTTAMTTGTAGLTGAMAAAFSSGAATLYTAITSANAGGSAMSGLAGVASVAAATGGYITGAGTSTSDSIPAKLSNGEYVVKAASVKKYGLDYLHAINTGRLRRYATGGLVSNVNIPKAPLLDDSQQRKSSPTILSPVIQQELVIDAGDMVSRGINSVTGGRAFKTFIRANKQTIKQDLGI
ncbi:phage tail length tape measure family protein [Gilliamella intestini]|uniref:Prophage tail length tape measure protein n=1 Tax=Gilliamella intestini TaxID=1798183 RepID=A0A1C4BMW8_9GAMM|nr:phage tail length tape measure family protein [Gilliamella intestini]SCC08225.1 Prophage tail length tape measure protein [Gilliamella intestini]